VSSGPRRLAETTLPPARSAGGDHRVGDVGIATAIGFKDPTVTPGNDAEKSLLTFVVAPRLVPHRRVLWPEKYGCGGGSADNDASHESGDDETAHSVGNQAPRSL